MKKEQLFPGRYMKGADLAGKPWSFKIKTVKVEEMGKDKEKKAVVYFEGPKKGLILSSTTFDQIAAATGQDDTDHWPGKLVTIYPTTVYAFGANHLVIRVRPVEAGRAETPDDLMHDEDELAELADLG